MSEPLSTSEIEDVLSSIRRLVSDDLRPVKPATPAEEDSKLLLTPALRVVQPEPEAEGRPIDDVVARVSAGVDQQAEEWEPETGDLSLDSPAAPVEAAMWEDVPVIDEYAANVPMAFVSTRAKEGDATEQAVAGLAGTDQADAVAAPVMDTVAVDAGTVAPAVMAAGEDIALDLIDPQEEPAPLPGWAQSQGAEEADAPRPDPVSFGTVEPDPVWADAAEAAVLQELQGAAPLPPQGAAAYDLDDQAEGELPVDEALLREIVRDVLREELQGRLGERITRNIRKLVRAEISRMMAAEELF